MFCCTRGRGNTNFSCFGPTVGAGATTLAFILFVEGNLSWHASGFVKTLTHHKDGTRLSAREKLILFVLADSHNETRGNCAWLGIEKAAHDALTSRSRFLELLKRLEEKGTISIERREGKSSLYRFPDLPVRESDPPTRQNSTTPVRLQDPTRPIAVGPKPLEPLRTDIQPRYARPVIEMATEAIRESQRTGEDSDAILERLRSASLV